MSLKNTVEEFRKATRGNPIFTEDADLEAAIEERDRAYLRCVNMLEYEVDALIRMLRIFAEGYRKQQAEEHEAAVKPGTDWNFSLLLNLKAQERGALAKEYESLATYIEHGKWPHQLKE